jgi:hypothetical protein
MPYPCRDRAADCPLWPATCIACDGPERSSAGSGVSRDAGAVVGPAGEDLAADPDGSWVNGPPGEAVDRPVDDDAAPDDSGRCH